MLIVTIAEVPRRATRTALCRSASPAGCRLTSEGDCAFGCTSPQPARFVRTEVSA